MSIIGLFKCDLCKREHRPNGCWWDNAHGGLITVCRDGINGYRKWEHLCPRCRAEICEAVDQVIDRKTIKQGTQP